MNTGNTEYTETPKPEDTEDTKNTETPKPENTPKPDINKVHFKYNDHLVVREREARPLYILKSQN
jgi:hypothetical protein